MAGLFHADGGLIPNGGFGIVGEEGPELVNMTSRGAMVTSNPDFMAMMGGGGRGMINNITINGSNLSEAQLSQALSDALSRFSRYHLPGRVAEINADPLARG